MDFDYSPRAEDLRRRVSRFMDDHIVPRLAEHRDALARGEFPVPFVDQLKELAKSEGLWNLFLPRLEHDAPGSALSNQDYAPLAEIMGRVSWASEVFNCSAPDTGNMELLHLFGTEAQRQRWLRPLLDGSIRSAFAMTEPDVASSDASNITTRIVRDGDDYVINGRKWFITNATHPRCELLIVMGKTDPDAEPHRQQSMILVPRSTTGVEIVRDISVLNHQSPEGHGEIVLRDVRVPAANLLGEEGGGFAMAQARLGPGRIHHCMRAIGAAELALELMTARSLERRAFGRYLHQHGAVAEAIARSRLDIDQARLLVLKTAWMIDRDGARAASREIAMIKAVVPSMLCTVCDRAMQVFGAMGLSPDTPLVEHWTTGRALRLADGPDAVHLQSVARAEIRAHRDRLDAASAYLMPPAAPAPTR